MGYNFDKDVIKWNNERGFFDKPFSLDKEIGYILSEILEALDWSLIRDIFIDNLRKILEEEEKSSAYWDNEFKSGVAELRESLNNCHTHDDFARWLVKYFKKDEFDEIDYCDMVTDMEVFSVGGRGKLNLNAKHINKIRKAVMDKNHTKKPGDVDEHGKQRKGDAWTEPEIVIEEILIKANGDS